MDLVFPRKALFSGERLLLPTCNIIDASGNGIYLQDLDLERNQAQFRVRFECFVQSPVFLGFLLVWCLALSKGWTTPWRAVVWITIATVLVPCVLHYLGIPELSQSPCRMNANETLEKPGPV